MPRFRWSFQPIIAGAIPNLRPTDLSNFRAVVWWLWQCVYSLGISLVVIVLCSIEGVFYLASPACPPVPVMSGHLQCTDTFAWSRGCPFMTGTTVYKGKSSKINFYFYFATFPRIGSMMYLVNIVNWNFQLCLHLTNVATAENLVMICRVVPEICAYSIVDQLVALKVSWITLWVFLVCFFFVNYSSIVCLFLFWLSSRAWTCMFSRASKLTISYRLQFATECKGIVQNCIIFKRVHRVCWGGGSQWPTYAF